MDYANNGPLFLNCLQAGCLSLGSCGRVGVMSRGDDVAMTDLSRTHYGRMTDPLPACARAMSVQ